MTLQEMKAWLEKNRLAGMPTGYETLSGLVDRFPNGSLTVIGARPAMGRYAMTLNIVNRISKLTNRSIAIISTRYEQGSTVKRLIQLGAGFDLARALWDPNTPASEQLTKYMAEKKARIHIMEDFWKSLDSIELFCERIPDLGLVILDGIESIHDQHNYTAEPITRQEAILWLKNLATQWNIPIICTVHLSPDLEEWLNKRPTLEALEKTGISPDTADTILFFYRDSYYNYRSQDNLAELIVAKSCSGKEGTAYLRWNCATHAVDEFE